MKVELWVPCEVWTSNRQRKMHHFAQAALVKEARTAAMLLARNTRVRLTPPVFVEFRPHQGMRGVLADTSAHHPTAKAVLDGCVDAKVIPDDTPDVVLWQTFMPPIKDRATGIHITIQEVNHEDR